MPNPITEKSSRAPQEEAAGAEAGESAEAAESAPAAPGPSGGLKAWLPLIIAVVTMPLLAFVTTRFILLPKLEHAINQPKSGAATETPAESAAPAGTKDGKGVPAGKAKITVPMSKLLVNVAGTMGTRYLMTSVTLVGSTPDFKAKIEENKDQLMDLATGALCTKTISDLEKPGARNQIRSELLTVMNNALGGSTIQEIYITELAIQ
jgi:flagellar FliL protein